MGHERATHSSTASSILWSDSFFLNISVIGSQGLLQKSHLGEKHHSTDSSFT